MRSAIIANRLAAALILAATASPAWAQPAFLSCLNLTQSWSRNFTGAVASVTYAISMPLNPAPPQVYVRPKSNSFGWLIGASANGRTVNALIGVPQSVATQYQKLTNVDAAFASARARFHELLLLPNGCPLLVQDAPFSATGAPLWTH